MRSRKTLRCVAVLACAVVALAGPSASADDKKDDKPALTGAWARTGGDLKMEFADKDVLRIAPHGDNGGIVVVCQYTTGKDHLVKVKVTEFEGKEELKEKLKGFVPVGSEFSFKWQTKDDGATLEDFKSEKVEALKSHLEGKYAKR